MTATVLFVCPHNAGPSRIAAAFLRHLAGDRYTALSAAVTAPAPPHPEVVEAMREVGVPVTTDAGTLLTEDLAGAADLVVALSCSVHEVCPELEAPVDLWGIPDLAGRRMDEVRIFRDTIRRLVERLIARLDTEAAVR